MTEPSETPPQAMPAQPTAPPYPYPTPYQAGPYQAGPYQAGPYQAGPYPGGYPPPPPQPYAGYTPPPISPRNGLGVAALVIGILALVSALSVFGGIILGIVAVILGFVGRGRVKRGEADNGGVALAGVVLGFLGIIAGLGSIVFWMLVLKDSGVGDYVDCLNKAGSDRTAQRLCESEFQQSVENKFSVTVTPTP